MILQSKDSQTITCHSFPTIPHRAVNNLLAIHTEALWAHTIKPKEKENRDGMQMGSTFMVSTVLTFYMYEYIYYIYVDAGKVFFNCCVSICELKNHIHYKHLDTLHSALLCIAQ